MANLEKIKMMNDTEIQTWLRKVDPADLKNALLGLDGQVRDCIFRNMSDRAVEALRLPRPGTYPGREAKYPHQYQQTGKATVIVGFLKEITPVIKRREYGSIERNLRTEQARNLVSIEPGDWGRLPGRRSF